VRILLLGKTQKKVAIIKKRTTGYDRVSLLLRQRINPARHIFHDISPLIYAGRERKRTGKGKNNERGNRNRDIAGVQLIRTG
jgi:hypothetical protein